MLGFYEHNRGRPTSSCHMEGQISKLFPKGEQSVAIENKEHAHKVYAYNKVCCALGIGACNKLPMADGLNSIALIFAFSGSRRVLLRGTNLKSLGFLVIMIKLNNYARACKVIIACDLNLF